MEKVNTVKLIEDYADRKALVQSFIKGEISKKELTEKGIKFTKPF